MSDTTTEEPTEAPNENGLTPEQEAAVREENGLLGQAIEQAANAYLKGRVVALNLRVRELEAELAGLRKNGDD